MSKAVKKSEEKVINDLVKGGIESEAMMLSSELYGLDDKLGNRFEDLPAPHYLLTLSGMFEKLARRMMTARKYLGDK